MPWRMAAARILAIPAKKQVVTGRKIRMQHTSETDDADAETQIWTRVIRKKFLENSTLNTMNRSLPLQSSRMLRGCVFSKSKVDQSVRPTSASRAPFCFASRMRDGRSCKRLADAWERGGRLLNFNADAPTLQHRGATLHVIGQSTPTSIIAVSRLERMRSGCSPSWMMCGWVRRLSIESKSSVIVPLWSI